MRNVVRGWRSARINAGMAPAVAVAEPQAPFTMAPAMARPEPLRFGIGLVGLVFYLWVIHSYKLNAGDVSVLALGIGVLARGGKIRVPPPLAVFGLFIFWSALTLAVSSSVAVSTQALIDLIKLWVISFCIANVIRTPAELRFLTIAWLAVFALYPVRGALFNHFICQCTEFGRVAWNFVFANPNDLAALCLIPIGAAAGVATVERAKFFRYSALIGVGVLALIVLLTQSRGAMLGLGVAVIVLPLTSRRRARDLTLIAVVLGVAALMAPKGVWERLAGLTNASVETGMVGVDPEGSAESRWEIWTIAGREIRAHPLTGVGIGMMPETNRMVAMREGLQWTVRGPRDTHSTYIRVTAETGFPGLILYLAMWGTTLVAMSRAKKATRFARPREHQALVFIQLAVIAFLVASVFGTYYTLSFTYIMLVFTWVTADTLSRNPWYVPPRVAVGEMPAVPGLPGRRRSV